MELKINISEEQFSQVLQKELDALTADELKQIVIEGLKQLCLSGDMLRNLFVEKYSDYGCARERPTKLLENLVQNIDISSEVKELNDTIITTLKENAMDLVQKILTDTLINGIMNNWSFQDQLKTAINEVYWTNRSRENH